MIITEAAKQIFDLSIAGYINCEKFTLKRFEAYARNMLKTADSFIFEICLPDGRWMAKFNRFGKKPMNMITIYQIQENKKHY